MTELYIGLEIWAAVGLVITAIILATPPWMDTLPRWTQIAIAAIGGPVLWIFISFFVVWMLRDNGPVPRYDEHHAGFGSVKNGLYEGNGPLRFESAADGS
jgi:MFS superfamily sulfate permease-like transporter